MEDYLTQHETEFKNSDNIVMCGDFNIDISLPDQKGRTRYIELLHNYGYESIYHNLKNEEFGEESVKTFHGKYNGKIEHLHLDQLFTKPECVTSFELGSKDKYVGPNNTGKSDHVPLIFEIDI